jgi:uncharacterized protein YukJ
MPLKDYGVLKGYAVDKRLGTKANAHYHVHLVDNETSYRIAINVQSKLSPSELEFFVDENFQHPVTAQLQQLAVGFTLLESKPGGMAIDFIRTNLFDRTQMIPLPFDLPGPDNDLNDKIDRYISRAVSDEEITLYAFGERWGLNPPEQKPDKIFGFKPGNGIHDIHMNQGNAERFRKDDGVYQDGALLIHFPRENQWVGIFLKFQSQTWHTDDQTGHRIEPGSVPDRPQPIPDESVPSGQPSTRPTPIPGEPDYIVRIIAALVNPIGVSPEMETVTLLNTSAEAIDLAGWTIANRQKQKHAISGTLAPGATVTITLSQTVPLSNQGGIITLLNQAGLKVHGVSYTKDQSRREGWTIVF